MTGLMFCAGSFVAGVVFSVVVKAAWNKLKAKMQAELQKLVDNNTTPPAA